MTDPRHGAPSASALYRLMNCPGSHAAQQGLPEISNPDAEEGTLLHAALAGEEVALNDDRAEFVDVCERQVGRLLETWKHAPDEVVTEERFALTRFGTCVRLRPGSRAAVTFSGQPDRVWINREAKSALLVDYKTGRVPAQRADENAQLAGLSVLIARTFKLEHITAAIVQPWCGKPTVVHYDAHALEVAHRWLLDLLADVERATPEDRTAGDWCRYCRAGLQGRCEVFNAAATNQIEVMDPQSLASLDGKTQRAALWARAMELPGARLAELYRGLAMVRRYLDAIEGVAKQRAADDPDFQQFYTLKDDGQGDREIQDAQAAFDRLATLGVTAEQMLAAAKLSVPKLQQAVKEASGIKSVSANGAKRYNLTTDQAGEKRAAALGDTMTRKTPSKTLVPITTQEIP